MKEKIAALTQVSVWLFIFVCFVCLDFPQQQICIVSRRRNRQTCFLFQENQSLKERIMLMENRREDIEKRVSSLELLKSSIHNWPRSCILNVFYNQWIQISTKSFICIFILKRCRDAYHNGDWINVLTSFNLHNFLWSVLMYTFTFPQSCSLGINIKTWFTSIQWTEW